MVNSNPLAADGYRSKWGDASISGVVLAAGTGAADAIAVKSAKHTIFIQKITLFIKTSAAQTITFQDDASTPLDAYIVEASAAAGVIRSIDYGARGFKLTEGKNFDIVNTAGPAYSYAVEAYQAQTSPSQATTSDRTIP